MQWAAMETSVSRVSGQLETGQHAMICQVRVGRGRNIVVVTCELGRVSEADLFTVVAGRRPLSVGRLGGSGGLFTVDGCGARRRLGGTREAAVGPTAINLVGSQLLQAPVI